jgi:O-antigen/teichoic acid export membrane protein
MGVAMLLAYAFHALMTRKLTQEDYGVLSVFVTLTVVVSVPFESVSVVLTRTFSKLELEGRREEQEFLLKKYLKKLAWFLLPLGIAVFAGNELAVALVSYALLQAAFLFAGSLFQARERFIEYGTALAASSLARFAVVLILPTLLLGMLAYPIGAFAVALPAAIVLLGGREKRFELSLKRNFRNLAATSILLAMFISVDLLFVDYSLGSAEAGVYNTAKITAKILFFSATAIASALLPQSSKLDYKKEGKKIARLLAYSIALLVPVALLFLVFPSEIITFLYTKTYAAASQPFATLTIGYLLYAAFLLTANVLWSQEREKEPLKISGIGVVMQLVLLYFLVPIQGIQGAATAFTASSALLLVLCGRKFYKLIRE